MQEVKVKPILWTHRETLRGEHEIRVRVTLYKQVAYLTTGFSSSKENWDELNECPKPSHSKYKQIVKRINDLIFEVDFEVKSMRRDGIQLIILKELRDKIRQVSLRIKQKMILEFFDEMIEELKSEGRIGYSSIFSTGKSALKKYLKVDKPFMSFNKKDFENYECQLKSTGAKDSTISVYIRTFNTLWNAAIKRGHCPKEHHPSKYFTFKAYRRFKTKKRAVSVEVMSAIASAKYETSSRIFRSQQMFLFSYYARGINFNDLVKLTHHKNLKGNELTYVRSKNKRRYQYDLHSKAVEIIEWFKRCQLQSDDGHIFPILMSFHDTPLKIDARVDSSLKDLNEDLKQIGKDIGLKREITSYVARHSFATNLRDKNVNMNIIQEAMGHETQLQTMTYLEEIDDSVIAKSIEDALKLC